MARRSPRLISSQMLPLFVAFSRARRRETKIGRVLSDLGLPGDVWQRHEIIVPIEVVHAVPDALAAILDDPLLGLHVAAAVPRGRYGLIEFCVQSAPTLGEACARLARYSLLLDDLTVATFEEDDREAVFSIRIPGEPRCLGRHANEFLLAMIMRQLRQGVGPGWTPRRVWFAHDDDTGRTELSRYFGGARIEFGQGANGLAFGLGDAALPFRTADTALLAFLDQQASGLLANRPRKGDLVAEVQAKLRVALAGGESQMNTIAAALHMSPRTLQRRLADLGMTYIEILRQTRAELARGYLRRRDLMLGEVAYLVGYSDVTTFVRAFKRATGLTPARYRARHPG